MFILLIVCKKFIYVCVILLYLFNKLFLVLLFVFGEKILSLWVLVVDMKKFVLCFMLVSENVRIEMVLDVLGDGVERGVGMCRWDKMEDVNCDIVDMYN